MQKFGVEGITNDPIKKPLLVTYMPLNCQFRHGFADQLKLGPEFKEVRIKDGERRKNIGAPRAI